MNFLRFYVSFETKEINDIFDKDIQLITEKTTTMGIEELIIAMAEDRGARKAEKKAEAQANRKALAEKKAMALEMKKDKLPMEQIAKFTKLPLETIQAL